MSWCSLTQGFRNPDKAKNRLYSVQSRSLPPASIPDLPEAVEIDTIQEEDSLDDEVFFDNKSHGTSALDLRVNVNLAGGDLVAAGALPRIDASQATDVSTYDTLDFHFWIFYLVRKMFLFYF